MKKSKFLKKSLAMLLALMLVVAMIPLSASAASINLDYIYVNDGPVQLGSTIGVKEASVTMNLTDSLPTGYELRVKDQTSTVNEVALTTESEPFALAQYRNSDNKIELTLYRTVGNAKVVDDTYTITVNTVDKYTSTNLDPDGFVFDQKGVYSATVDNINGVVNVVLARNTANTSASWTQGIQDSLSAEMTVSTLENATIAGETTAVVGADNGDSFTVYSEDGKNHRSFTVKATYLDAMSSLTITGTDGNDYTGTPVDTDYDDIADTITVTLPASAVVDGYGEIITDPTLAVSYEAEGHNNIVEVGVNDSDDTNDTTVKSDGSQSVTFVGLGNGEAAQNYVLVTRLPAEEGKGATQYYTLKVQLEKSSSTTVVGAIVNRTIADVDNDARTIVANLPNAEITDGVNENVTLWLAKGATASIDNTPLAKSGSDVTEEGVAYDIYTMSGVNLTNGKVVTVKAQDGTTQQYALSMAATTNVTDATITAFWLKDPDTGATYAAEVTGTEDDLTVTVPYMTTKITNWIVYVTPANYTYVTTYLGAQVYSGGFTAYDIGFADQYVPTSGDYRTTLTAINKNNPEVTETYTIHVKLDTSNITTGHELSDLHFTAQPTTNGSDKEVYRAIRNTTDSSCNLFNAEVEQETNGNHNVGTVNLQVPYSLTGTDDLGRVYQNIVTSYETLNDQGHVFLITADYTSNNGTSGNYNLKPLEVTADDDNSLDITGDVINNQSRILVLSDEIARKVLTSAYDTGDATNLISAADAAKGTMYQVTIDRENAQSGTELKSMSIGNTELTITDKNEITGTLNFSQTISASEAKTLAKGHFAAFELSDYAKLTDGTVDYFSDGDIEGDGVQDTPDSYNNIGDDVTTSTSGYWGYNNYKFLFVRNNDADQSVTVWRISNDTASGAGQLDTANTLIVEAEDRLDDAKKTSSSTYTFNLNWAAPNEEAEISSFKIGNFNGTIVNSTSEARTITVEVPYGTDVTGLVADFTASAGSTLWLGNPENGVAFESGVTSVNYTNPVNVYIRSEDGDTTHMYTITVKVGLSFSDVPEDAWYHDNVMDAANNGYVSGMGDGTFNPLGSTTRAQFSAMIANAMGYEADPDVESAFPDVADDYWGKAAINFCYQNEIITGYDDGTFQPEKTITRQEAAAILNNAFELAEKYGISDELFPDDSAISTWAEDHVYAAKAAGLMKGDADTGNFRPTSTITRAEAASILMNAQRAGVIN